MWQHPGAQNCVNLINNSSLTLLPRCIYYGNNDDQNDYCCTLTSWPLWQHGDGLLMFFVTWSYNAATFSLCRVTMRLPFPQSTASARGAFRLVTKEHSLLSWPCPSLTLIMSFKMTSLFSSDIWWLTCLMVSDMRVEDILQSQACHATPSRIDLLALDR